MRRYAVTVNGKEPVIVKASRAAVAVLRGNNALLHCAMASHSYEDQRH